MLTGFSSAFVTPVTNRPSLCLAYIKHFYWLGFLPMNTYFSGRSFTAVHVRPGVFENVILDDVEYSYDNPDWFMYVIIINISK